MTQTMSMTRCRTIAVRRQICHRTVSRIAVRRGGRLYAGFCPSLRKGRGRHLSGARLTAYLGATLLVTPGRRPSTSSYRARVRYSSGLAPGGVYPRPRHRGTPCALTARFHPYRGPKPPAVCFCGTFLRVSPTGRYPAPCPMEPGRSSTLARRDDPAPSAMSTVHEARPARKWGRRQPRLEDARRTAPTHRRQTHREPSEGASCNRSISRSSRRAQRARRCSAQCFCRAPSTSCARSYPAG